MFTWRFEDLFPGIYVVEENGLGEIVFWALIKDAGGRASLLWDADDLLRKGASYTEITERPPALDAIVGGNGDFSLSNFTSLV